MRLLRDLAAFAVFATASPCMAQGTLYVDAARRGHDINPGMYGIFFEEINHSGDGGLYAEMIQNRGFEEQTIPGGFHEIAANRIQTDSFIEYNTLTTRQLTWDWDYTAKKMTGWRIDSRGCEMSHDVEIPEKPLHEATPNAMRLTMSGASSGAVARLINSGYWGIAVDKDAAYDLRFYLNTKDYSGKVKAIIYDSDCVKVIAETEFDAEASGEWVEYKGVLTASADVKDGNFALVFSGDGTVYADYVSLFPQDTFMGRPNGMRPDIARFLVDLKPSFLRWPGGCIVEGMVLGNRVRWKETLGDPMTRPGEYDLWGYRSTWGMGYHEILQFCEDAGMDCMFVGNAGLSCIGWGGQYVSGDDVEAYYEEIRDAIEYAIGDPSVNEWAARRAQAGHPGPFPLKYVEIGNENFTARYDANYKYIYGRLKEEYPQLTFLNTMGLEHAEEFGVRTDMIDPHWYVAPDFFYNNRRIFDDVPRGNYEVYVGEYATNVNVGSGNMDAALSEAVFMMDMERNSDLVRMASYAPLITNDNAPNWTCNLIWQHSGEVFGRASYYTQKMFAENLPTYNIVSSLRSERIGPAYEGRVGVGTWSTSAEFRNFKVSDHEGNALFVADFSGSRAEWADMQGEWSADEDGIFSQSAPNQTRCISLMNRLAFRDCVIEVEAKKVSGAEGFLLVFGCDDEDWNHYYQLNIGGWYNTGVAIEDVNSGTGTIISERKPLRIESGRWYSLKLVCRNGVVEGYIDGELYCSYDFGTGTTGRIAAHAGYDDEAGEIVLKVVNAEGNPLTLDLNVNAEGLEPEGVATVMSAASLWDENSFSVPDFISPESRRIEGVATKMHYTFEPYSLTVMRLRGVPASEPLEIPAVVFSTTPRELSPVAETGVSAELRRMISEAQTVAFDDVDGGDALRVVAGNAETVLKTGDEEAIKGVVATLDSALETYYKGVMAISDEITEALTNPHFEKNGDNSGWRGNPTVNEHVAEIFNSGFNISQQVSGLEDGWYLVYAQGYYRNGSHPEAYSRHADGSEELLASFTVNDMSKPVVSLMSEVHDGYWWGAPNTMAEANTVFSESSDNYANYLIAYAEGGVLDISFSKTRICETDWFCFDNVRLFRVPTGHAGVMKVEDAVYEFSPEARIYSLDGRLVGGYAGLGRLPAGIYVITENGRSAKVRR